MDVFKAQCARRLKTGNGAHEDKGDALAIGQKTVVLESAKTRSR